MLMGDLFYLPLYCGDYLKDTVDLSAEEHGAYLLLLIAAWSNGGWIDSDPKRLARIARLDSSSWPSVWSAIARFWEDDGEGHIRNQRLSEELEKARGLVATRSAAGAAGAHARWQTDGKRNGKRIATACALPLANSMANTMAKRCYSESESYSESEIEKESESEKESPPCAPAIPVVQALVLTPSAWKSDPRPSARPSKPKSQPPQTEHDRLLSEFSRQWAGLYKQPYSPTPKDKSQLGRVMNALTAEELRALPDWFANYFADASRFVVEEQRHSLAFFCTSGGSNKYRVRAVVRGSEKERRTQNELDAWAKSVRT